jgi:hypothetical protein
MDTYNKIKTLVLDMEKDVEKIFVKHQSQAAIRTRSKLQEIRALSKELRQEIQDSLKDYELNKNNDFQL